jgi:hypothetical protein
VSISEKGIKVDEIVLTNAGWYFYFKDGSCRIGPYSDKKECQKDFELYLKTGRISNYEKRKLIKKED